MKKSTDRTVFVRFVPPSSNVRRHHLEELFSQIGPIKKSSVILPPPSTSKRQHDHEDHDDGDHEDHHAATATAAPACYGFIKYTSSQDAVKASEQLNLQKLVINSHETVTVHVERATTASATSATTAAKSGTTENKNTDESTTKAVHIPKINKMTNRLIVRNLAFQATEHDIRETLETKYNWKLIEVHLPKVPTINDNDDDSKRSSNKKKKKLQLLRHRGFAFVTFEKSNDAQQALLTSSNNNIEICGRPVKINTTVDKTVYEQQQSKQKQSPASSMQVKSAAENVEAAAAAAAKPKHDEEEENEEEHDTGNNSDNDDDGGDESSDDNEEKNKKKTDNKDTAIVEKRTVFIRNLPFDCTRYDLFELLRAYGRIESIFLVRHHHHHHREPNNSAGNNNNNNNSRSGLFHGTAFCTFTKPGGAARVIAAASSASQNNPSFSSSSFVANTTNTAATGGTGGSVQLKGRTLLVDLAVDKETAHTLTSEKQEDKKGGAVHGKDRRNLYLKFEGRVGGAGEDNDNDDSNNNNNTWQDLPESDKLKRQKAWSDKNSKLQSPVFFINPKRLSIKNLAKHVDEVMLKRLCVTAIKKGLGKNLAKAQDQIHHLKATGTMTTRQILQQIQSLEEEGNNSTTAFLPAFDDKNVKKYIPSVFIDRDYDKGGGNKNKGSAGSGAVAVAPSRGFGFVEFAHHVHALACLRELNNNTEYAEEYVAGGKHAILQRKQQRGNKKKKKKRKKKNDDGGDGDDGDDSNVVKCPRLIVEFTVENMAKAKLQAEHRAQQEANIIKQKLEHREKNRSINRDDADGDHGEGNKKQKRKKSRGALQRERKRKQREEEERQHQQQQENGLGDEDEVSDYHQEDRDVEERDEEELPTTKPPKKKKMAKKKQKVDKDEAKFTQLVESYKREFTNTIEEGSSCKKGPASTSAAAAEPTYNKKSRGNKRWFDS